MSKYLWYDMSGDDNIELRDCINYIYIGGYDVSDIGFDKVFDCSIPTYNEDYIKGCWNTIRNSLGTVFKAAIYGTVDGVELNTINENEGEQHLFYAKDIDQNPISTSSSELNNVIIFLEVFDANNRSLGFAKAWKYNTKTNKWEQWSEENLATKRYISINKKDFVIEVEDCYLVKTKLDGEGESGRVANVVAGTVSLRGEVCFHVTESFYNSSGKWLGGNSYWTDWYGDDISYSNTEGDVTITSTNDLKVSGLGSVYAKGGNFANVLGPLISGMPTGSSDIEFSGSTDIIWKNEATGENFNDSIDYGKINFAAYVMPEYMICKSANINDYSSFYPSLVNGWKVVGIDDMYEDSTELIGTAILQNGDDEDTKIYLPCLFSKGVEIVAEGNWDSDMKVAWDSGLGDPYFITLDRTTNTFTLVTFSRKQMNGKYVSKSKIVSVQSLKNKGTLTLNIARD